MMSHEIRSPMNGIISVAEILDRGKLGKEQKQLVGVINQSAETLLTIIDDILDLSKIEAGKLAINRFDFDLPAVITGVADLLAPSFHQKNLSLNLNLSPDLPRFVHGDANRIRQILFNLLGNAAKFTEQGGATLTATSTELDGNEATIDLVITDTGIGINREVLDRLFQPFEQADSSVARQYGGTGLGLSICRRLAQLMAGEISVSSKEGHGSTFTLTISLPLAKTPDDIRKSNIDHDTSVDLRQPEGAQLHILVVEDNHINQIVIGKILRELGCSYDTADDGILALDKFGKNRYDLVLTDLRMPNMDGFALARAIRDGEDGENHMPIVAVSADAMEEARDESARSGIDAFLTKPIKIEDVRRCLESHVGRQRELKWRSREDSNPQPAD
ncbi:ATP-binding protein [Kordiimonas aestuarii]|uniref:ATP-binding protein n=1 Tax=Kordiimonas aestuarii TaxID=1005925 RepID=UPI00374DB89C